MDFSTIDITIFALYAVLILSIGLYVSRQKKGETKSAEDYFLAGKSLPWWAIGASLIAANISAEQFIGMSGSGFALGLAIASYEWMAAITLRVVGKYFLPIFIEKGLSNVDEVWGTEVPLYYPGLYAGTTDCVGVWKGKPAIIDFKTTRKPKKREWIDDYFLQGAAYSAAHNEIHGTDIKTIVIMMIGWDEEADNKGNYQEFVVEETEFSKYSLQWANKVQEYFDKYM